MEYERKCVTITWQIENVKCCRNQEMNLFSPVIPTDVLEGTKWKLEAVITPSTAIRLIIKREKENEGPEEIGLDYEGSVTPITALREKALICKGSSFKFEKDRSCPEFTLVGKHKYPIPDKIIIRCKMWKQHGSIQNNVNFFLRTRMKTESFIFIEKVENFSGLLEGEKKTLKTILSPTGEILASVTLRSYVSSRHRLSKGKIKVAKDGGLKIEITFMDKQLERNFDFEFRILDSSGKKSRTGTLDGGVEFNSHATFTLHGVSKERLLKKASLYLPNDTLSLHCELTICSGTLYEEIEKIECETDSVTDVQQTVSSNELQSMINMHSFPSDIPCDTEIQTATETFQVHADILKSQSSVFEAMFASNMKEAIEKCVHIDDVDTETVKRMLFFLYSGKLKELQWKDALELYCAADKYQIISLKNRCSALLKQNIDLSSCIVLLLVTDMHQDNDLRRSVEDYITKNDLKVLFCDQWIDLEKNVPQLALNYFRNRCLKNRML